VRWMVDWDAANFVDPLVRVTNWMTGHFVTLGVS